MASPSLEKQIKDLRMRYRNILFKDEEENFKTSPLRQEGDELLAIDSYESIWHILRAGEIVHVKYEEISKSKQRDIDHYRNHGRQSCVVSSEIKKMKEMGLYQEGDDLLTNDYYNGYFIVLRNGNICRVKYSEGSWKAELEEAVWWEKAKRGEV